ncbi:hypothetical protein V6N13_041927 [Hibiscus sabdariffa]|uniref:Uncharacterized protein n=1 Tax=Hibiscus sabdariffa TaxID=183260 RepID=A0ABR2DDG4_9ROSI
MLGPLFEDLRGPSKYTVSQISGSSLSSSKQADRIIPSDDTLGVLGGAYLDNRLSKTPVIILLCITSFQLFFLVLKKPFIKKRVQLVEIISLCCEAGMFATCYVLLEKESSTTVGIF